MRTSKQLTETLCSDPGLQHAQGCVQLPCSFSSACNKGPAPGRLTSDPLTCPPHSPPTLPLFWLVDIPAQVAVGRGGQLLQGVLGGLSLLGVAEGSTWLRELAGDAELGAARAARDRGG